MYNDTQNEWFCKEAAKYRDSMIFLAMTIVRNPDDAEDALQSALLKAYENLPQLKAPEKFKPWLYRVLVNECCTLLRRRRQHLPYEEWALPPAAEEPLPEKLALWDAVQQLRMEYRTVILLYYYEGLSVAHVAGILRISPASAKKRLQRARDALKTILEQGGEAQ